ncbi:oxidoreductase [Pyrococcus sp. NA2]|uniref:SDR family NAD(P)-dependent oxidoreductase n=1 Tax=Pyrococcus sp. (strain NA2) TaxID=342949 RepID=UPI000209B029|nr:SDR family NAD(P)-dependent oxidoreductase [Pyrococcus sp. NA2]AEC51190.1 oxidoreductase [Pyrococcus sp. NA2]
MRVLLTGASGGIGREIAKELINRGYEVIGVGRNEEALKELGIEYITADLSTYEGIFKVRESIEGKINVLINNAGFGILKPLLKHSWEELEEMFRVNTIAPIILTKELLDFIPEGGKVVFIISGASHVYTFDLPGYGASKVALHYMAKILEEELKERGIRVLRVYPKQVATGFWRGIKPRGTLSPDYVARKVVDAIESDKRELFIPWYLRLAKFFELKYRFKFKEEKDLKELMRR